MHSILKTHSVQSHSPFERRRSIKSSNWPYLLIGYRVTSALIKCVDAIKVERVSLLYVHVGIEKKKKTGEQRREEEERRRENSILIAQSVSGLTLRRVLLSSIIWSRGERPRSIRQLARESPFWISARRDWPNSGRIDTRGACGGPEVE